MAGEKISALPIIPSSQLTDIAPFTQTGITYKVSNNQLIALYNANIQLGGISQVTGLSGELALFLPLAGGTMAGTLILDTNTPTTALEAASKGYVDSVAVGLTIILACLAATTTNLNATYANGTAGVGATLTDASGTFAVFTVDGLTPALNSRILVKNQTLPADNGIYVLTTNGDTVSIPYVLTRSTDYDTPAQIQPGTLIAINSGTVNASTSWLETATVITIGTDPILFSQFTFAPSSFLLAANNLSDVVNVATSRTNLGLGTAAVKAASDNGEAVLASVTGAFTVGHSAIFADTAGTIEDGGAPVEDLLNALSNGRMTLTSGVPVTTSNVTAATTLFFTPYKGNQISLFDGTATWTTISFAETSIAIPGTASTMYDLFAFNNSGTMNLETQTWVNDTTRAVPLILQDGIYVKSGATTRRYLGSFRTTTVVGQTEDSLTKRYVWNYANRIQRSMLRNDPANSWAYSVAAFRQANGNVLNELDFVIGVSEDLVYARIDAQVINSTAASVGVLSGIGLDSTTVNSATATRGDATTSGAYGKPTSQFVNTVVAGRHILAWLERGAGSAVQSWFGVLDANGNAVNIGINGWLFG
jgi:hypothetical protein